jgi:hemolysin activation/secretion protein
LNQNPFRNVGVDLKPGAQPGTTDVYYKVTDVAPVRGYVGYDDTGVQTLGRERLSAGFIYGNAFGNDGTLSYQYTTDGDLRLLHAHALSWNQPIDCDHSFRAYGSWAGLTPAVGGGLNQTGDSWQLGMAMVRHLQKSRWINSDFILGLDFKSTNNNLEFGGANVQASAAELFEIRVGHDHLRRGNCDQYSRWQSDFFVGPGDGFSSNNTAQAFSTIRPNTSPDYISRLHLRAHSLRRSHQCRRRQRLAIDA